MRFPLDRGCESARLSIFVRHFRAFLARLADLLPKKLHPNARL
jgi:hypothetical protein